MQRANTLFKRETSKKKVSIYYARFRDLAYFKPGMSKQEFVLAESALTLSIMMEQEELYAMCELSMNCIGNMGKPIV